jgi:hypothetical protein
LDRDVRANRPLHLTVMWPAHACPLARGAIVDARVPQVSGTTLIWQAQTDLVAVPKYAAGQPCSRSVVSARGRLSLALSVLEVTSGA